MGRKNFSIERNRSNHLGKEIKKRLLMGAYFLENSDCLKTAKKLRSLTYA
jgi:hypothetical protein